MENSIQNRRQSFLIFFLNFSVFFFWCVVEDLRFSPVINDVGIVLVCASSRDLTEPCENICYCCPFSIRKRIEEKLFFYFLNTFFFFIVVGTKVQDRAVENPSVCAAI